MSAGGQRAELAYTVKSTDQVLKDFEASFTLARQQVKMFTPEYIAIWIERLKQGRLADVEVSEEWVAELEQRSEPSLSDEELQRIVDRHAV